MSPSLLPFAALRPKGIDLSLNGLWRLEREGKFPRRVRITKHRHAWVESEIDEWLNARVNARTKVAA